MRLSDFARAFMSQGFPILAGPARDLEAAVSQRLSVFGEVIQLSAEALDRQAHFVPNQGRDSETGHCSRSAFIRTGLSGGGKGCCSSSATTPRMSRVWRKISIATSGDRACAE